MSGDSLHNFRSTQWIIVSNTFNICQILISKSNLKCSRKDLFGASKEKKKRTKNISISAGCPEETGGRYWWSPGDWKW